MADAYVPLAAGDLLKVTALASTTAAESDDDYEVLPSGPPTYGIVTEAVSCGEGGAHIRWLLRDYLFGVEPEVDTYEVLAHEGEEWPDEVCAAVAKYQLLGGENG